MVLTSNDIRFSWGVSEPVISNEISKPVADLYKEVVAGFDSKPSLFFAFPPMLKGEGQGGDVFIAELDKVSGGNIPVFGSIPITNENGERMSRVLYMGKAFESSMALLAFYGDVKPEFYTAALSEKALYTKRVKVTGTKLNVIESINDMPVSRYLETIGLSPSSVLNNMPLVFYPPDGSRLFRVCQKIRDDGALIITGTVPLNAELSFSSISDKDVIESTENLIENIMAGKTADNRSLLIYACCSRFWMLGYRWKEEPGKAVSLIKEQIPWQFVYSGGELFPSILEAGKVSNHLQNYSVTVCVL
jgi:hypothetical protein